MADLAMASRTDGVDRLDVRDDRPFPVSLGLSTASGHNIKALICIILSVR